MCVGTLNKSVKTCNQRWWCMVGQSFWVNYCDPVLSLSWAYYSILITVFSLSTVWQDMPVWEREASFIQTNTMKTKRNYKWVYFSESVFCYVLLWHYLRCAIYPLSKRCNCFHGSNYYVLFSVQRCYYSNYDGMHAYRDVNLQWWKQANELCILAVFLLWVKI